LLLPAGAAERMTSLFRLLESPSIGDKIVIGDFRSDIAADATAERTVQEIFPELDIITSVEGTKLVPVRCLLKLHQRLEQERSNMVLQHQSEVNQATDAAYNKGYDEGYRKGLDEGHADARKVIDNFASAIKDAVKQREILYNDARKNILDLVIEIARKITFDSARIDHEVTAGMISGVIDRLVDKTKVKIKVHPDHYPVINQQIERFRGDSTAIKEIAIEPDSRVRYGGCYIETPTGDIDARVESQMDIIEKTFIEDENES